MRKPTFSFEKKLWREGYKYVVGIDEVGRGAFAGPIVVGAVIFAPTPQIKNSKLKMKNWEEKISDLGINDSKLLKAQERERLAREVKKHALVWDITEVGVSVINKIGIGKATEKAMRKGIRDIVRLLGCYNCYIDKRIKKRKRQSSNITIQQYSNLFVLVDYFYISYLRGLGRKNQLGIKKGDQKSISIAAASILAKVYRDKLMQSLSKQSKYKKYGWGRNKQSLFRAKGRDIYGWARNKGYGTSEHQKAILRYGLTQYHRKEFVKTFLER